MRKFTPRLYLLLFLFLLLVVFPTRGNVRAQADCRKTFDKEMYRCLTGFNACQAICSKEGEKPDGTLYFNAGEVYTKCMKARRCHEKSSACSEQAVSDYRSCVRSGNDPAASEAKQETLPQDKKGVNIFKIFDFFSKAVTDLATKREDSDPRPKENQLPVENPLTQNELGDRQTVKSVDEWIMENGLITDASQLERMEREKLDLELYGRTPKMTEEIINKAQEEWESLFSKAGNENVDEVNGQGWVKTSNPELFITIPAKDEYITYTYYVMANVPKGAEIEFIKPVQDEKTQELKRMLKLNKGEVEIKVKNDNAKNKFGVQGDFFDLFVIQTHFWVSQNQDKNLAVIGVYEGEVEVKTRDGKTIKVKPDGDKPGIVVINQQLSVVKLAVIGLILTVLVGGTIWFIKKKNPAKFSKKR